MSKTNARTSFPTELPPLCDKAVGAVVALIRVAELYDPAVAHRAALRAVTANELVPHLNTDIDRSIFVAVAALSEVDLSITRPDDPEVDVDPTRALLADSMLGRLPGLFEVGAAIGARRESFDGSGDPDGLRGEQIPLPARVLATVDELVANPAAGFLPSWEHGRNRVRANAGSVLDPAIAALATNLDLDDIEIPLVPSLTVGTLLNEAPKTNRQELSIEASTITTAIASAGDTQDVLELFAQTARDAVDARDVAILSSTDISLNTDPVAWAVRAGSTTPASIAPLDFTVEAELRAGVALQHSSGDDHHIDTIMAPVLASGQGWGVIIARRARTEEAFDSSDVSSLRHVASETGTALTSASHWAEMQRMALCDQLTGLANRHELYRVLDDIFERPATERADTALIMCDVDGLKIVNDTLGHQAGDRLLKDAAAALQGAVRDPERTTTCRIGGDEFCLVIDGGGLLTAHEISETIDRLFARSGGSNEARSISCGIAFATEDITSRSALLRAADLHQYETKHARKAALADKAEAIASLEQPTVDRRAIRD